MYITIPQAWLLICWNLLSIEQVSFARLCILIYSFKNSLRKASQTPKQVHGR